MQLRKRWAAVIVRLNLKLSQTALAELACVSLSTIKRFEFGESVNGDHQESILKALKGGLELLEVTDASPRSSGTHKAVRARGRSSRTASEAA